MITFKSARWVALVLGLWLILSPYALNITGTGRWNNVIVGVLVFAAGYLLAPKQAPT